MIQQQTSFTLDEMRKARIEYEENRWLYKDFMDFIDEKLEKDFEKAIEKELYRLQ